MDGPAFDQAAGDGGRQMLALVEASVRMTTLCHQSDAVRLYVLADLTSPA